MARIAGSVIIVVMLLVTSFGPSVRSQISSGGDHQTTQHAVGPRESSFGGVAWDQFITVKQCAREYHVDWQLIVAMIKQESKFDADAVSMRGARGLMQLMPVTNMEVASELNLSTPYLPEANIQAGVYYFSKLLDLFKSASPEDRFCLALAAYNAGPGRIYDAQELAAYFNENPFSWSTIQHLLPLLSKRYYSLHQNIWKDGKPRSGYFGSGQQTITYVGEVMNTYNSAKKIGY